MESSLAIYNYLRKYRKIFGKYREEMWGIKKEI